MQAIIAFLPGLAGAAIAFSVIKLLSWTELGFEFGAFLATYVVVSVSVDRGMKRYGRRLK